jgi:hypothetical protein
MADQNQQTPDVVQLWRDWLTQSERQVNAFMGDALNQDASARSIAGFMEAYATLQRLLAEGMQRYLSFINMPSRSDVTGLGETLRNIEDRLARIEETLQIAAAAVDQREEATLTREPARTRQAPEFPEMPQNIPSFNGGTQPAAIPEELRR